MHFECPTLYRQRGFCNVVPLSHCETWFFIKYSDVNWNLHIPLWTDNDHMISDLDSPVYIIVSPFGRRKLLASNWVPNVKLAIVSKNSKFAVININCFRAIYGCVNCSTRHMEYFYLIESGPQTQTGARNIPRRRSCFSVQLWRDSLVMHIPNIRTHGRPNTHPRARRCRRTRGRRRAPGRPSRC